MENKNYYDWLEISKKASPEVIEKAYKALVKKYHPDLQEGDKQEAEEILKKINEAYDVLSDNTKRAEYDATLKDDDISREDYDRLKQELNNMKQNTSQGQNRTQNGTRNVHQKYTTPQYNTNVQNPEQHSNTPAQEELEYQRQMELERQRRAELEYQRQVEAARQKAYHDAYIQDLRNRGYRIRYKKSFKDYIRIVVTVIVIALLFVIAWHIPFIHNWFVDLYNDNEYIQFFVNIFINTD